MSGEYFLANRMGIEPGKPIAGSEFADCSGRTTYRVAFSIEFIHRNERK